MKQEAKKTAIITGSGRGIGKAKENSARYINEATLVYKNEVSNASFYVAIVVVLHNKHNCGCIVSRSDLYFYNKQISSFHVTNITA
jgi:hypothetical protein